MEKAYLTGNKNGKWDCNSSSLEGDLLSCCGLTWPPKYYTCSFCKREFKSAQALGGHMNVHRKDRARLRMLSSWALPCQDSEPNSISSPTSTLSSPSLHFSVYPHHSLLSPLLTTPRKPLIPQHGDLSKEKTMTSFLGIENLKKHAQKVELEVGGVPCIDLKDSKEVLDLELRLGYF